MPLTNSSPPWEQFTTTDSAFDIDAKNSCFPPRQLVGQTFASTSTVLNGKSKGWTTAYVKKPNVHSTQRIVDDPISLGLGTVHDLQGLRPSSHKGSLPNRICDGTPETNECYLPVQINAQGTDDDETIASDLEDGFVETLNDLVDDFEQDDIVHVPDCSKDVDGHTKGQIGYDVSGNMYQREKGNDPWRPASYHYLKRDELAAIANSRGSYDHDRRRGEAETDETCFLPLQKTWSTARKYRPEILFQLKRINRRAPDYKPIAWVFRGRILVDTDNHEIKKWWSIPDVLASVYEELFIEAVERGDERIKHKDFRARMPKVVFKRGKATAAPSPNTITQRLRRARISACCLSWRKEGRSDNRIPAYIVSPLPQECVEENNTQKFRDLLDHEYAEALLQNLGNHAERARVGRGNDEEKSKAYRDIAIARAKDLKVKSTSKKRSFSEIVQHSKEKGEGPPSRKKHGILALESLGQQGSYTGRGNGRGLRSQECARGFNGIMTNETNLQLLETSPHPGPNIYLPYRDPGQMGELPYSPSNTPTTYAQNGPLPYRDAAQYPSAMASTMRYGRMPQYQNPSLDNRISQYAHHPAMPDQNVRFNNFQSHQAGLHNPSPHGIVDNQAQVSRIPMQPNYHRFGT